MTFWGQKKILCTDNKTFKTSQGQFPRIGAQMLAQDPAYCICLNGKSFV